jgi:hypothetical protein
MYSWRHRIDAVRWLALCALAAVLSLPVIAQLPGPGGVRSAWAEVCTSHGMRLVDTAAPDADAGQGDPPSGAHSGHCALCVPAASVLASGPSAAAGLQAAPSARALPILFLQAPRTLFAWRSAQPRGPPLLA